jgi:hypothetical protein
VTYVFIAGTVGGFVLGVIVSCWWLYDLATAMVTRRDGDNPMVWK